MIFSVFCTTKHPRNIHMFSSYFWFIFPLLKCIQTLYPKCVPSRMMRNASHLFVRRNSLILVNNFTVQLNELRYSVMAPTKSFLFSHNVPWKEISNLRDSLFFVMNPLIPQTGQTTED